MIKIIFFDFDGVLCESVDVKTQAFTRLFEDYPKELTEILSYHTMHGGVSRFKKFEYIYKNIIKKPLTDEKSQELGRLFTSYALEAVINAPMVKGAMDFLENYHKKIKLYVVSGTPHEEMVHIAKVKKIDHYFQGVFGSPTLKEEIVGCVLKEKNCQPKDAIFVGDSITDYHAALHSGVYFLGRVLPNQTSFYKDLPAGQCFNDLVQLKEILRNKSLI